MNPSHSLAKPLVTASSALLLWLLPVHVSAEEALQESIPVLARILEKSLESGGVTVEPLQWTYLGGRGVLFFGGVDLAPLRSIPEKDRGEMSEDDLVWENTRREVIGQPPVKPDDGQRLEVAIEAARSALQRFAGRIPLSSGEEVRLALYQKTSTCSSCHAGSATMFGNQQAWEVVQNIEPGKTRIYTSPFVDALLHRGAASLPSSHPHVVPREVLVMNQEGTQLSTSEAQGEDAAVLARVLGKKLGQAFPDEYWGVDMSGRPGTLGLTVGDWGPVVMLNLTFPLEGKAELDSSKRLDLWEETLRELRGELDSGKPEGAAGAGEPSKKRKGVDASRLLATVKEVMAGFGGRVRGLAPDQEIMVVVFGDHRKAPYSVLLRGGERVGAERLTVARLRTLRTEIRRPSYILRLPAGIVLESATPPGEVIDSIRVE